MLCTVCRIRQMADKGHGDAQRPWMSLSLPDYSLTTGNLSGNVLLHEKGDTDLGHPSCRKAHLPRTLMK